MIEEMACQELVERVTDYLDGALSPHELARVHEHLASCDGCRAHIEQMRITLRVLEAEPGEQASPELAAALTRMFHDWAHGRSGP